MTFNWFNIFNLTEWLATGLVSRKLSYFLTDIGDTEFLITQGNETGVTVNDVYLPLNFEDNNPYAVTGDLGDYSIYLDEATQDVWVGFEVEE